LLYLGAMQNGAAPVDQDLDTLIQYLVGFCSDLLEKYGEFYPVGAYIDVSRGLIPLGVYDGDEAPESEKLIARYEEVFIRQATEGTALAWAVAWDARVSSGDYPGGTDAVAIKTFHAHRGQQVQYLFPYSLKNKVAEFADNWWAEYL
jgi:hypothetical protein